MRPCSGLSAVLSRPAHEEAPSDQGTVVPIAAPVSKDVLVDVLEHPSGYLALSRRNRMFVVDDIPGFIAYRTKGKHIWLFGGVHARSEHAGALLDRFLDFATERHYRVAAVQVRESQVDLFAGRGFTVNQLGSTYAVSLEQLQPRWQPKNAASQQDPEGPPARAQGGRARQGRPQG